MHKDSLFRPYIFTFFSFSVISGINFFGQIYLATLINPETFGEFATAVAYVLIITSIFHIQGDKYLITSKELESDFATVFFVEIVLAFLSIVALMSLAILRSHDELTVIVTTFAICAFSPALSRGRVFFERNMQFGYVRFIQVAISIISFSLSLGLLLLDLINELMTIILFRYLPLALEGIYFFITTSFLLNGSKFSLEVAKDLLKKNSGLWFSGFIIIVYSNVDYIILETLGVVQTAIGQYWLSFVFLMTLTKFRSAINEVLFPHFKQVIIGEKHSPNPASIMILTIAMYSIPFILIFLIGESTFKKLLGEEWANTYTLILIFMIVGFVKGCVSVFDIYLLSKRQNKYFVPLSFIYLASLILFGFPMANYYSVHGLALSVMISTAVTSLYSAYICLRSSFDVRQYYVTVLGIATYMLAINVAYDLDLFYRTLLILPIAFVVMYLSKPILSVFHDSSRK